MHSPFHYFNFWFASTSNSIIQSLCDDDKCNRFYFNMVSLQVPFLSIIYRQSIFQLSMVRTWAFCFHIPIILCRVINRGYSLWERYYSFIIFFLLLLLLAHSVSGKLTFLVLVWLRNATGFSLHIKYNSTTPLFIMPYVSIFLSFKDPFASLVQSYCRLNVVSLFLVLCVNTTDTFLRAQWKLAQRKL